MGPQESMRAGTAGLFWPYQRMDSIKNLRAVRKFRSVAIQREIRQDEIDVVLPGTSRIA